ncbi:serine hydrolase domain-containing protein [Zafaria sp. Z1313]|uniref:serine hydrolase domain-containing protein n=1 Tax=Zafaria sp. Z1313 TaxID=3423202 RepID=UPI003D302810
MSSASRSPAGPGAGATQTIAGAWRSVLDYAPRYLGFQRAWARQPGVQVAAALDGEPLGGFAVGFADLAGRIPLETGHLFRVASHSKTFTAVAVLQLVEAGALRLDDAVAEHVPELAGTDAGGLLLGDLLSHSTGIVRDGADADFWQLHRAFPDRAALVAAAAAGRIAGEYEHFKYTNIGYGLLGLAIAAASGTDYRSYVREHIVDRLGLADTGPDLDPRSARGPDHGGLATGYASLAAAGEPYALGQRVPVDHVDTGALDAATGFYSTAADLVRFFSALLPASDPAAEGSGGVETAGAAGAGPDAGPGRRPLLSERSKRRMRRRVEDSGLPGRGYGLGLILQDVHGTPTFGHSGGYPGHITRTWACPGTGIVLSVLANAVDGPAAPWGEAVFALAALALKEAPASYSDVPAEALERFTGRFAGLWGVQDVVLLGGRLYALPLAALLDPEHILPLEFVDGSTLRSQDPNGFGGYGEELSFEFDSAGASAMRGPGGLRMVRQADYRLPERITAPVPAPGG